MREVAEELGLDLLLHPALELVKKEEVTVVGVEGVEGVNFRSIAETSPLEEVCWTIAQVLSLLAGIGGGGGGGAERNLPPTWGSHDWFLVQKVRGSKAMGQCSSVSSLSGARPCPGSGGSVPGPFLSQEPWWANAQPSSSLTVVVLFFPWESRSSPGRA